MTDNIVPSEDLDTPIDPTPADPIEPEEDDEELSPEADPVPPQDETPEQLKARLAASEEARKKLYARLQREKSKGKPATPPTAAPSATPATPTPLTRDEAIIIAKGYSEEELEQAKKVSVLENCTPVQALEKDLFKDWKTRRDKDETDRKAQLPTSRGGRSTVKKSFSTPGLSDEDHKQMFQDKLGR